MKGQLLLLYITTMQYYTDIINTGWQHFVIFCVCVVQPVANNDEDDVTMTTPTAAEINKSQLKFCVVAVLVVVTVTNMSDLFGDDDDDNDEEEEKDHVSQEQGKIFPIMLL